MTGASRILEIFSRERNLRIEIAKENVPRDWLAFYIRNLRAIFLTRRVNHYNIEFVLEHETIHHALYELGLDKESRRFDHLVNLRWVRKNDVI